MEPCYHSLSERTQSRCDELEVNLQSLLLHQGWNEYLNLEEEHVIRLDDFPELEEVLVESSFEIVDQVASGVPVVSRSIEYFELDERRLASLHCCVVFVPWVLSLRRHVLNLCKRLHWVLLFGEERREPAAEASALLLHLGQLNFVLELHFTILLSLLAQASFLLRAPS